MSWLISQNEANQRENWFKSHGWVFSALKKGTYVLWNIWVSRSLRSSLCVGGCCSSSRMGGCMQHLALAPRGIHEGGNTSWADFICSYVPPDSRRAGENQQVLQCYPWHSLGLETSPKGWDWPLPMSAVRSIGASHSLFVPEVPALLSSNTKE